MSCAALECNDKHKINNHVKLHRFPLDPKRKKIWMLATKRTDLFAENFEYLCSRHFAEDCFELNFTGSKIKLKYDAIPTIFKYPEEKIIMKPGESDTNESIDNAISTESVDSSTENRNFRRTPPLILRRKRKLNRRYIGDIAIEDVPEEFKNKFMLTQSHISTQQTKIKNLQKQNLRLKEKNSNLYNVVVKLSDNAKSTDSDAITSVIQQNKSKRKFYKYSHANIYDAINAVKNDEMSILEAVRTYKVPKTTLLRKLSDKSQHLIRKTGPTPELGYDLENKLKNWILECTESGFVFKKIYLLDSVQQLVRKYNLETKFVDGRPGRKWLDSFQKRYKDVEKILTNNTNITQEQISENKINEWFKHMSELLQEDISILKNHERLFNCDEIAFSITSKESVIMTKTQLHLRDIQINPSKTNLTTTLFTVNANGLIAPPLTISTFKERSSEFFHDAPPGWGIENSKKGLLTGQLFFDYISNIFNLWLDELKIKRPVILFLHRERSHLTIELSEFCKKNQIIIVALNPYVNDYSSPLEIALFHKLTFNWNTRLDKWKNYNGISNFTESNLVNFLNKAIRSYSLSNRIKEAFKKFILLPFNYTNNDNNNPKKSKYENKTETVDSKHLSHLEYLEKKINPALLASFKNIKHNSINNIGNSELAHIALYFIWEQFVEDDEKETKAQ